MAFDDGQHHHTSCFDSVDDAVRLEANLANGRVPKLRNDSADERHVTGGQRAIDQSVDPLLRRT